VDLPEAVWPVHHPTISGAHFQIDAREHLSLVEVNIGVMQSHDDAALARPVARDRLRVKRARVLLQQGTGFFRAHPAALPHDALRELQQV